MKNIFDKSVHYLGNKRKDIFIVNIGAMDGVMFDELIGYTNMYGFKGLYVEPIPYLFDKLKENLKANPNNIFENSAISDYDGEIEMLTIDRNAIDSGLVHNCFYGMSAVYPPKNGLGSEGDKATVEKYGNKIKVKCITFPTLMRKHNITHFDIIKIDAEGHDFHIFKQIDLQKYSPEVIRLEWINLDDASKNEIKQKLSDNGYVFEIESQDITAIKKELYDEIFGPSDDKEPKVTIVTGIWDIQRNELADGWNRNFEHYLSNLQKLMKTEDNMIIYIEEKYKDFVLKHRKSENTLVVVRELEWFKNNGDIYKKIQNIRANPKWYNQSGWIPESTQAKLEMYNPIVMSKMFLLNDAAILDPFNSTHLVWIDGALTNTVHEGYFWKDKVIQKLGKYFTKFSFVCFPYNGKVEIHGFKYDEMCKYANADVNKVARGGIFGGPKTDITMVNNIYYDLLNNTLDKGLMGTEESLFTLLLYQHPEWFNYFEIDGNGLLGKFFENLKNDTLELKSEEKTEPAKKLDISKVGLYVITFNSPKQFEKLILSMLNYDSNFINKTRKFLLDNSTDLLTTPEYLDLCKKYGFEHIKKDNLGICGGRQFIAEHFASTDLDYMWFSEDDMFFQNTPGAVCRNGFNRYVPMMYQKSLEIMQREEFDFLKINYSEFFGDNGTQWAWYNLPIHKREELFPDNPRLPEQGLGNPPKTKFNNIKSYQGIPYTDGEIYYCNWTQLVSKTGNKKMFLNTKWEYPHEQTWMSHIYQLTKIGDIKPGLLLLTPVEHNRFDFYDGKLRKES